MRTSNKEITVVRSLTKKITAATENFISISEYKDSYTIVAIVKYSDNDGKEISRRTWYITGKLYDLLMSDSPEFAPGKPVNEYRESDLWYIIDQINGN